MTSTQEQGRSGEEQLRYRFRKWEYGQQWIEALDEALDVERVRTVERIRLQVIRTLGDIGEVPGYLWRILDGVERER